MTDFGQAREARICKRSICHLSFVILRKLWFAPRVKPTRVIFCNEYIHEKKDTAVAALYPQGIHSQLAAAFASDSELFCETATLEEKEHGLPVDRLDATDVLVWWGHLAHKQVEDEIVERVKKRVLEGMGLVVLHSGHYSKIFQRLLGTTCSLGWREAGEKERVWVCQPGHPIARDLPAYFEIPHEEMYSEPFGIPNPDELVFISWFQGGEVFRSGCCWRRGAVKIFYFRPGHETFPTYRQPEVLQVIRNGIGWAAPDRPRWIDACPNIKVSPEGIRQER
jgi:trehalose utilization protein